MTPDPAALAAFERWWDGSLKPSGDAYDKMRRWAEAAFLAAWSARAPAEASDADIMNILDKSGMTNFAISFDAGRVRDAARGLGLAIVRTGAR